VCAKEVSFESLPQKIHRFHAIKPQQDPTVIKRGAPPLVFRRGASACPVRTERRALDKRVAGAFDLSHA
jgi:hypothetical protein